MIIGVYNVYIKAPMSKRINQLNSPALAAVNGSCAVSHEVDMNGATILFYHLDNGKYHACVSVLSAGKNGIHVMPM